tara:strand:- start:11738 stop:13630 length:1893 start_codon:yes stop_codon:yes gene_type:complete
MCGIGGIFQVNRSNNRELSKLIGAIKHRGPDNTGTWFDKNISLGNTRLKVVDLDEKSNQPFKSANGKYIIIFNGEIYNHKELKKNYNIKTNTNSDTEVIVELFSKIGVKSFNLLDGMFSIAIYDIHNSKLYLSRDPFGIKPLYYSLKNKKLIFCSEIKGIINQNSHFNQNDKSIIDFIKWGGLDHSNQTWFKNIFSLNPGSFIVIDKKFLIVEKKFYFLNEVVNEKKIKKKDIPYQFKTLLNKSVKDQSETVRSIGSNLSGGVDSSIVTMFLHDNKKKIDTYTFGYNEKKYDERRFAKKVSKSLNVENFTSICSAKDINQNFIDTLIMEDEPFTSFRQVSHHKLYKDYQKNGSTVILESSGGDEIGAGYTGFLWPLYLDQLKEYGHNIAWKNLLNNLDLKKNNKDYLSNFITSGIENQKNYGICTSDGSKIIDNNLINPNYEKKFDNGPPNYPRYFKSHLQNSQYIELFHTKLPRGLRYVDRASSGSGREARVPLLTKELVEFCFAIPNNFKIREGELRWFMKKSLKYLRKNSVELSNKRSVADPQRTWIRKDFKNIFLKLFKSKKFLNRGVFNQDEVLKNFDFFLKKEQTHSLGIFQIFITEVWFRLFIDHKPSDFNGAKLDEFVNETN